MPHEPRFFAPARVVFVWWELQLFYALTSEGVLAVGCINDDLAVLEAKIF